jgi:hypothetical protein
MALVISVWAVIAVQTLLLAILQFGEQLLPSTFLARKTCHAGSGLLMLHLDPTDVVARVYVYSVVAFSLSMTWQCLPDWFPLRTFRFGEERDAGITIYLLIVCLWFACQQPPMALAPLFFADPAGAVVGKFCTRQGINTEWWENKTVAGTGAVLAFAYVSLDVPQPLPRLGVAVACALAEAFGGKTFDNAVLAVPALGSWLFYHGWA